MSEVFPVLNDSEHQHTIFKIFQQHYSREILLKVAHDTSIFMRLRYGRDIILLSIDKLYRFISVLLTMCTNPVQHFVDYWSDDPNICNDYIKETLDMDLFLLFWNNLRYYDTRGNVNLAEDQLQDLDESGYNTRDYVAYMEFAKSYEKEHRIDPVINRINALRLKLQELWMLSFASNNPNLMQNVDQHLILLNGDILFQAFNSDQPSGFDVNMTCNNFTGYICGIQLNPTGENDNIKPEALENAFNIASSFKSIINAEHLNRVKFVHKTRKLSNRIFMLLLQISVFNSFIVFKSQNPTVVCSIKDFYFWLASELRNQAKYHRIFILKKEGEYDQPKIQRIIRMHSVKGIKHRKITQSNCVLCFKYASCYCKACNYFYCKQCSVAHVDDILQTMQLI
ncbi:PiggyBac_transposable element-derived protein [Hexamita inflata]|uniref:PiggyBac transposable element-derived protein n=1 Tax=Hexamita inflata TaxID=28002 RepID=A0AA86QBD1_9EUKA|nr:PiggyBac transposable element-derived protein [Hexamita inflata]